MKEELPFFDQWYKGRKGATFDELWMQPGQRIDLAFKELALALCEYTTEMVKRSLENDQT